MTETDMKYSKEAIILLPFLEDGYKPNNDFKFVSFFKFKNDYYLKTIIDKEESLSKIDNRYKETINLFIEGKYSKITETHKQKILKYWNANADSVLFNVLYPKKYQYECYGLLTVKAELWTKPQVEFL